MVSSSINNPVIYTMTGFYFAKGDDSNAKSTTRKIPQFKMIHHTYHKRRKK